MMKSNIEEVETVDKLTTVLATSSGFLVVGIFEGEYTKRMRACECEGSAFDSLVR